MTQKATQEEALRDDSQKENPADEPRLTREEIQNMSYWELWGVRRKAGPLYFVLTLGVYAFIAYLFLKVCYLFYIRDFSSFGIDWWAVLLCLAVGFVYWSVHELLYKKHGPTSDLKK